MGIYHLFSKRQADAAKSGVADVYQYEIIPKGLRNQVAQIALESLGTFATPGRTQNTIWAEIENIYLREKGLDRLSSQRFAGERVESFMRECSTADWLDLLELIVLGIEGRSKPQYAQTRRNFGVSVHADDAIDEINYRLFQAGVGYQLDAGQLMRVDSQYLHAEVVKPALVILASQEFEGPCQEFLSAHRHYRANEHRQAVTMAANAVESTFKAIFDQKGWSYQKGARISDLIKIARTNGLWPDYLDASFDQLVATLQSGLPKIRDNDAAHGQGATPKNVPSYIVAYALHLAASKIVFIVEAAKVSE